MKKCFFAFVFFIFLLSACSNQHYIGERYSPEPDPDLIQRELVVSISERSIYFFSHYFICEENGLVTDIYLEVDGRESRWLYNRDGGARPEFRAYYGKFFDDDRYYLLFIDREHGGHGGGHEKIMIFDAETFEEIPKRRLENIRSDFEIIDDNVVVSIGRWRFEILLSDTVETYRHGNQFQIENNRLVEYFFFNLPIRGVTFDYALLFRIEYILEDGEISVSAVNFISDEKYYGIYD